MPALGVVLFAALAVRVVWLAYVHPNPLDGRFDDTVWYRSSAHFLALGKGYVNPFVGTPTAAWPPGYPVFLGALFKLFGEGAFQTYAANVALALLTVAVVYCLALVLFDRTTALIASAAMALWPGQIYFTSLTLSELLFTFLFTFALLIAVLIPRAGRYVNAAIFAFGFVTVAAFLTRGQALLLLPLAVVAWRPSGVAWRSVVCWGILAAVVVAVALAPWVLRNDEQLGSPVIIATNLGPNVWLGNHPGATGRMDTSDPIPVPERNGMSQPQYEVRADALALRKGIGYMLARPFDEIRLASVKIRAMYESDSTALDWNSRYDDSKYGPANIGGLLRLIANAWWFAAIALAAVGLFALRDAMRSPAAILPITLLAWTGTHLLFFGDPRFHYPVVFVIAILGARGAIALADIILRRPQPALETRYAPA